MNLSLGWKPWDPPGTGENRQGAGVGGWEAEGACEELLSSLGGCHETFAISPWVLMRTGALLPLPPKKLQNIKPLSHRLDWAPQQCLALLSQSFLLLPGDQNRRDLAGAVASFLCLGERHTAQI